MGKKYKVVYDISGCIGAAVCHYVDNDTWVIRKEDGKATIKYEGVKKTADQEIVFIDEKDLPKILEAAKGCPVRVIHVYDESGKEISP